MHLINFTHSILVSLVSITKHHRLSGLNNRNFLTVLEAGSLGCQHGQIMSAEHSLPEKVMAPHSRTLAWKVPWTEEPGRLQSMGSLRVRHDWVTSLSLFTCMHWRRKWQPTPVFLPGGSQGWGSLVGCRLWGRTESDTTEVTKQQSALFLACRLRCYYLLSWHFLCVHEISLSLPFLIRSQILMD